MKKTLYTPDRQSQSARLVSAREAAGYTQKQVEELIGISQSELSKIEQGQRKVESLTLKKLADLYRRPVWYFITDGAEPAGAPLKFWLLRCGAMPVSNKIVFPSGTEFAGELRAGDIALLTSDRYLTGFVRLSRVAPAESGDVQAYFASAPIPAADETWINEFQVFAEQDEIQGLVRPLDESLFSKMGALRQRLLAQGTYPGPLEASLLGEDASPYLTEEEGQRELLSRQIRQRRGADQFRKALLEKHNGTCMISGCKILSLLEAAQIRPGTGQGDITNGLLLRADLHTLFDLDFIGIDPQTLEIKINTEVMKDGYEKFNGQKLINAGSVLSKEALEYRWKLFLNNC